MLSEERCSAIRYIAEHYGIESQQIRAIEEISELAVAICKMQRIDGSLSELEKEVIYDHLAEEIADTKIMVGQLEHLLKMKNRVTTWMDKKLERQLGRIECEKKGSRDVS